MIIALDWSDLSSSRQMDIESEIHMEVVNDLKEKYKVKTNKELLEAMVKNHQAVDLDEAMMYLADLCDERVNKATGSFRTTFNTRGGDES